MTTLFNDVKPGDLIRADLWNQVLHTLISFDTRITALESTGAVSGGVVITSIDPFGSVQVGDPLQINGQNFDFSIGATRVSFNGVSVSAFLPGSNDTVLIVKVPDIQPPQGGMQAMITVSNHVNSASTSILVTPLPQPVFGPVSITPGAPTPSPTLAGQDADFPFTVVSQANLPGTYVATATIANVPWQGFLQILDSNKGQLKNSSTPLTPNLPTTLYVRIHPIPAATTGTPFSLSLSLNSGTQSGGTSGLTNYTVGQAQAPQDDSIGLTFGSMNPTNAISGDTITIPSGSLAILTLLSTYTVAGQYNISAALSAGAANWKLQFTLPTPPDPTKPNQTVFTPNLTTKTMDSTNLNLEILPQASASSPCQLQVTIQRVGATTSKSVTYNLQL
jgi:hypothetical protein